MELSLKYLNGFGLAGLVEAKNDNTILQLLKEYLKTNLGSPASLLQSQTLKLST